MGATGRAEGGGRVTAWHDPAVEQSSDVRHLRPRLLGRRFVNPTVGLALLILIINVGGLVSIAAKGEAFGRDILTIVGICDVTVGAIALARSLRDSAVALGVVTLVVLIWPDPIFAAARLVAPAAGQAVGESFIISLAALWVIITGVAIARLLRGD